MAGASLLSPFITIWTEPRATIRAIVERDPRRYVLGLAALGPALVAMESSWSKMLSAPTPPSFLWPIGVAFITVVAGALGVAVLYFNGWALQWIGRFLGGEATSLEVRAALAWSRIPGITAALINISVVLLGVSAPAAFMNGHLPAFTPSFVGLGFVNFVLGVWSFVVLLQCLGEVHGFSAWRALAAIVIEAGIFILLLILLVMFAEVFGGHP
jgi:Yip1 domain